MKFSKIIKRISNETKIENFFDFTVDGITDNSNQVKNNYIFAAIKGKNTNGEKYINKICKDFKIAIIVSTNYKKKTNNPNVILIKSDNVRKTLGDFLSILFPNNVKKKIAVTGTNGKTSVVYYTHQIWNLLKKKNCSVGTLGIFYNKKIIFNNNLTTPTSIQNHELIHKISKLGCNRIIFEASSIGLDQLRLYPFKFDSVAFTNITRDHLDYHKSFIKYKNSKINLFENYIKKKTVAVLYSDSKYSDDFKKICRKKKITILDYGKNAIFFKIKSLQNNFNTFDISFILNKKNHCLKFEASSKFEVLNKICALLLVFGEKIKLKDFQIIKKLKNPPGRLEKVFNKNENKVFIDYAHTPDALENVLSSLSLITKGRLVLVFGCGGDRDKGKRPKMTKIALKFSDKIIITDDNPRYEKSESIVKDMTSGLNNDSQKKIITIENRRNAIKKSINILKPNDTLLIAGKGHEKYQIYGAKKKYFCDKETALEFLLKK